MPETLPRPPSKKRLFLFRIIAIASPFVLLLILEMLLRLFHYGNNLDLFIESPGNSDYYVFNPAASKRYFTNQAMATSGNSEPFKKEKDEGTLRIFILGESTTIGYPYFHNGSFHRWLLFRMMNSFPDKKFEFINCSLTAVNSYTVLGFAKELVHYQPDAVMIYTGHNEYYGVMGVGSTDNMGSNGFIIGLVLWLRQFRFVQLLTNFYTYIRHVFQKNDGGGGTRMELMVKDQKIAIGSDAFKKGIEQFARNMNQTLKIFNRNHVPVFLSTLVSNDKDLKPFVNLDNALRFFNQGSVAYQKGNYDSAKRLFQKASDLDGLRFRAPSAINGIIRELASKYDNVHLVDTRAVFETHSVNGIIGNELVLEHVHPNLDGYALMSDAFYESMKKNNFIQVDSSREMPFALLKSRMPVSRVDSLAALYRMGNLKRSWPFSESMTADSMAVFSTEDKIAYALANKKTEWYTAMDSLYNYYIGTGQFDAAKTVVEGLVLEYPEDPVFASKTGTLYGKLGDFPRAVFYLKRAFDLSPSPDQAMTIFVLCLKMDRPAEAMAFIDYASGSGGNQNLLPVKTLTRQIMELEKKDTTQLQTVNEIAEKYMQMGNKDGAEKYNKKALKINAGNKEAMDLKQQLETK
jgi:tetratricopeptide (TPR) repeat protein